MQHARDKKRGSSPLSEIARLGTVGLRRLRRRVPNLEARLCPKSDVASLADMILSGWALAIETRHVAYNGVRITYALSHRTREPPRTGATGCK